MEKVAEANFPSKFGNFKIYGFKAKSGKEYVVLGKNVEDDSIIPIVRIHSQCLTGDALGSLRCDCGEQLQETLKLIEENGRGLLIYQPEEGRGIGILNKLKAYELQDRGLDTVEANEELGFRADLRSYEECAQIISHFGFREIKFISNNPEKIKAIENMGIKIVERIKLKFEKNEFVRNYLEVKKKKMGHLF